MTNKDVSKAISVKDKEALHLEVVDGKLAVKRICEDFVIVNLNDIPSNREELIHFNNKYLAPNGLGIDAGSLSDVKVEQLIETIKETFTKENGVATMTDYTGPLN